MHACCIVDTVEEWDVVASPVGRRSTPTGARWARLGYANRSYRLQRDDWVIRFQGCPYTYRYAPGLHMSSQQLNPRCGDGRTMRPPQDS